MGREGRPSREIRLPAKFRDDEVELPHKKPQKLFCACRQPYEKGAFMIACDATKKSRGCLEWCHGTCIGISREEAKKIKQYMCAPCQAEAGVPPQSENGECLTEPSKGGTQQKRGRSSRGGEKVTLEKASQEEDIAMSSVQGDGVAAEGKLGQKEAEQADMESAAAGVQNSESSAQDHMLSSQENEQIATSPLISSLARTKLSVKRRAETSLPRASSLRRSETANGSVRVASGMEVPPADDAAPTSSPAQAVPVPEAGATGSQMAVSTDKTDFSEGAEMAPSGPAKAEEGRSTVVQSTVKPEGVDIMAPVEVPPTAVSDEMGDSKEPETLQAGTLEDELLGHESKDQDSSQDMAKWGGGQLAEGGWTKGGKDSSEKKLSGLTILTEPKFLQRNSSDLSRKSPNKGSESKGSPGVLKKSDSRGAKGKLTSPRSEAKEMLGSPRTRAPLACAQAGCNSEAQSGQPFCSDNCAKAAEKEAMAKKRQREGATAAGNNATKRRTKELSRSTSAGWSPGSPVPAVAATSAVTAKAEDSPKSDMTMRQKLRDSLAAAMALVALAPDRTNSLQSEPSLPKEPASAAAEATALLEPSSSGTAADTTPDDAGHIPADGSVAPEATAPQEAGAAAQELPQVVATEEPVEAGSSAELAPAGDAVEQAVGISQAEIEDLQLRAAEIAAQVEGELFTSFGGASKKYRERARSLLFNLKDANNPELRQRVMSGEISPQQLAQMTAEQLASRELSEWRNAKAELHAQQVVLTDADVNTWRVVKKTHKGEVEVVERHEDMGAVSDAAIAGGLRTSRVPLVLEVKKEPAKENGQGEEGAKGLKAEGLQELKEAKEKKLGSEEKGAPKPKVEEKNRESGDEKQDKSNKENESAAEQNAKETSDLEKAAEGAELPPIMSLDEYMEARNGKSEAREPSADADEPEGPGEDEPSYSPIYSPVGDADEKAALPQAPVPAGGGEAGSGDARLLWDGKLQIGSAGQAAVKMLYRSAEKLPVADCMRDVVEVKGRVRLSEMDRFLSELRASRSRAVMVVSFVGTSAREMKSLQEVAEQYRSSGRVGFVELRAGGELYLLPAGEAAEELMHRHGHSGVVEAMGDEGAEGEVLVGTLIRRRALIPSYSGTLPVLARKAPSPILKTSERKPEPKVEPASQTYDGPPGFEGHVQTRARPAAELATPVTPQTTRAVDRDPRRRRPEPEGVLPLPPARPAMVGPSDEGRPQPTLPPTLPSAPPLPAQPSSTPAGAWGTGHGDKAPSLQPPVLFSVPGQPGHTLQEAPRQQQVSQQPSLSDPDDLPEFQFDAPDVPVVPHVPAPPMPMRAPPDHLQPMPVHPRPALNSLPRNAVARVNDALPPGFGAPPPPPPRPPFRGPVPGHTFISQVPESHILGGPLVPSVPRPIAPPPMPRQAWQDATHAHNAHQEGPPHYDVAQGQVRNMMSSPGPPSWPPQRQGMPPSHHGSSNLLHPPLPPPPPLSWERPQLARLPGPPRQEIRYDNGLYGGQQPSQAAPYMPGRDRWPPLPKGRDYSKAK